MKTWIFMGVCSLALLVDQMTIVAKAEESDAIITCDYSTYGVPFASVTLKKLKNGDIASQATVHIHGQTHEESFTQEDVADGETLHGWISKEKPENALELIIYSEERDGFNSVLINHNAPFGKVMDGICHSSEIE
jgi:hypothetical protein